MGRRFAAATVLATGLAATILTIASCTGPADGLTEPPGTSTATSVPSAIPSGPGTNGPASAQPSGSTRPANSPGTTTASPSTAGTTPATTPTVGAGELSTPTSAAQHLYEAWEAGDQAMAELGATHSAVAKLFAKTWTPDTYFFGGCATETECDYNFATGVIRLTVAPDGEGGYMVTDVEFGTAN